MFCDILKIKKSLQIVESLSFLGFLHCPLFIVNCALVVTDRIIKPTSFIFRPGKPLLAKRLFQKTSFFGSGASFKLPLYFSKRSLML